MFASVFHYFVLQMYCYYKCSVAVPHEIRDVNMETKITINILAQPCPYSFRWIIQFI